jgi:hypothetical protein
MAALYDAQEYPLMQGGLGGHCLLVTRADANYSIQIPYWQGRKMNAIDVRMVTDKAGTMDFLQVPFTVFKGDPNWVAPLFLERLEHLSPKKNPYFKHARAQLFVAYRDGKPVGRISAQIDQLHLDRYMDQTGQFGFLDAVDDADVFKALTTAAENWLRQNGMMRTQGPFNFSINDEMGMLLTGYDRPANMMMGHGRPYFIGRTEACGYRKVKDVIAYEVTPNSRYNKIAERATSRALSSPDIKVRTLSKKNLTSELNVIMTIFNDAWSDNWNFVPFTADELVALGNNLKMLVSEGYIAIAEYRGEPAAMAVTLPNLNEWIYDLDGRLLPFGWAKLAWRLMRSKHNSIRLPLMGVLKKYQDSTLGGALALSVIEAVRKYHTTNGIHFGEMSWILEDNTRMRNIIEACGAVPYKTYRVFEKQL